LSVNQGFTKPELQPITFEIGQKRYQQILQYRTELMKGWGDAIAQLDDRVK
jgi:hypothetical protein